MPSEKIQLYIESSDRSHPIFIGTQRHIDNLIHFMPLPPDPMIGNLRDEPVGRPLINVVNAGKAF